MERPGTVEITKGSGALEMMKGFRVLEMMEGSGKRVEDPGELYWGSQIVRGSKLSPEGSRELRVGGAPYLGPVGSHRRMTWDTHPESGTLYSPVEKNHISICTMHIFPNLPLDIY